MYPGMKKGEIQDLYLQVLCDREEITIENLQESYENFQKRLDKAKGQNS